MTRKKSIRLLIFGAGDLAGVGGVQLSYSWLLNYLVERNYKIKFMSHVGKITRDDLYYEFPADMELESYALEDTPAARQKIASVASNWNPDVVLVVNSARNALVLTDALRNMPCSVVLSERGGPRYCIQHLWASRLQRELAHWNADFTHLLMPGYKEYMPSGLREQVTTIPSLTLPAELTADPVSPDKNGRFSIVYSGRLSFEKDLDFLISAFSQIKDTYPLWDVKIAGGGPEEGRLRNLVDELGMADRVQFLGNLSDIQEVYRLYSKSHIFVLPSRAEGCPLALREAMAHGLPVVGYEDCSGTNEIIKPNRNGVLVPADDKIDGMASALRLLMDAPQLREELGAAGKEDIREYAPELIHGKWDRLLQKAAGTGRIGRQFKRLARTMRNPALARRMGLLIFEVDKLPRRRFIFASKQSLLERYWKKRVLRSDYRLLFGCKLFDPEYYLKENPDVKLGYADPLYHYLTVGWRKNLKPSPDFDPIYYMRENMTGIDKCAPLLHYYRYGRHNGALPSANVDEKLQNRLELELDEDFARFGSNAVPEKSEPIYPKKGSLVWSR